MKLELRGLKVDSKLSRETIAFTADLYADGVKAAVARNHGHGASNLYDWVSREARERVEAWAAAQPTTYEFEKLDQIVNRLIAVADTEKWLARNCKTKTVFRLVGDHRGDWRTLNRPYGPEAQKFLDEKYPGKVEVVANVDREKAIAAAFAA